MVLFALRYDCPTSFEDMGHMRLPLRIFHMNQLRAVEPQRFVISGHMGSTHRSKGWVGSAFGHSFDRVMTVNRNNGLEEDMGYTYAFAVGEKERNRGSG